MTATVLRNLHVPGRPLVLPNVWDADSARLVVEAGFPVVATSSAAVAAVLGYDDEEQAPADEMLAAAARIVRAVDVPVTVDAESGYGLGAAELVDRLRTAGAVGCNLEDTEHGIGRLREPAEQADFLAAIRQAAGESLVINARIDCFLGADDGRAVLAEALDRAGQYLKAGADCVYPIHVRSTEALRSFSAALAPASVNATYLPSGPNIAELTACGVARVSLGAGLWRANRSWLTGALAGLANGTPPY